VNVTKTSTGVAIHLADYQARRLARVLRLVLDQRGPSFIFDDYVSDRVFIDKLREAISKIVGVEVKITAKR
jgi:hypothetical protein